jgi:hypothetical protein
MGEVKRRCGEFTIEGPVAYEIRHYRLEHIFPGLVTAMTGSGRLSDQAMAVFRATGDLATRMQDERQPTMLCMTCDHEFQRNELPVEIVVAISWANPEHPQIVSPVCGDCAAADCDTKTARVVEHWNKLSPGARCFDSRRR